MLENSNATQLTLALTVGLGCGIIIGALLASKRRNTPLQSPGNSATAVSVCVSLVTLVYYSLSLLLTSVVHTGSKGLGFEC